MLEDFKKFVLRGNVVDLAVAVVIGAAFGGIVTSLVQDLIMPIVGAITGGLDFSNYYFAVGGKIEPGLAYVDAKKQGAVIGYGQFLTVAINFLIIAAILFLIINSFNRLRLRLEGAPKPAAKEGSEEVRLLREIRDLLAKDARS